MTTIEQNIWWNNLTSEERVAIIQNYSRNQPLAPRARRILIIDDDESICSTLHDILEYEDYEVETASDGEVGLSMIMSQQWDIVLCDVKMPKLDGIEVLEQGLKHNPKLPFIMISGYANIDTAVECARKGCNDFIHKPVDLNRLLVSIRNAFDKGENS